MDKQKIWQQVKFYFDSNDGSLPEFRISNLKKNEIREIFKYLLELGDNVGDEQCVWFDQKYVKCNSFESSDKLFDALLAVSQHVLIKNITLENTELPPVGVFILENEMELDYRMGEGWDLNSFFTLIELFKKIKSLAPSCSVSMPFDGEAPFQEKDIKKLNDILKKLTSV